MSNFEYWQNNIKDKKIQKELKKLTKTQKNDNFETNLEFGTAGMRGVMQVGSSRMNVVTVSKLAYAVGEYLQKFDKKDVVICFDTRLGSKSFSRIFAKALLLHGVDVYLFKKFAPTPLCVFMTKKLGATLGVMITASHNNKTFNGIKIYDQNGIQIDDVTQVEISQIFNSLNEVDIFNQVKKSKPKKKAKFVSEKLALTFVDEIKDENKKDLKIVYTPLNGTGLKYVSKILRQNGYKFFVPKSQKNGNGEFKTCPYPNPEFEKTFFEAKKLAIKKNADLIIATDPDADRIGVMVKNNDEYIKLSGNEVAYVFAQYLVDHKREKNSFVVTSVVTSPLVEEICKQNNIICQKTLTGFLSIGTKGYELQQKYGKLSQLMLCEESCGYVVNNSYFDKDGIYATLLMCDICSWLKSQNKSVIDYLNKIYTKYGYVTTLSDSVVFEGNDSKQKMKEKVDKFRQNPPKTVQKQQILKITDYLLDNTGLKKQNFLKFESEDITVILRPSGTEPKLKLYVFAKDNTKDGADKKASESLKEFKTLLLWMKK